MCGIHWARPQSIGPIPWSKGSVPEYFFDMLLLNLIIYFPINYHKNTLHCSRFNRYVFRRNDDKPLGQGGLQCLCIWLQGSWSPHIWLQGSWSPHIWLPGYCRFICFQDITILFIFLFANLSCI